MTEDPNALDGRSPLAQLGIPASCKYGQALGQANGHYEETNSASWDLAQVILDSVASLTGDHDPTQVNPASRAGGGATCRRARCRSRPVLAVRTTTSRILTTHAGSLPRPPALAELHGRRSRGEPVDPAELRRVVEVATAASIAAQVDAGIDIGNDGEQARESFVTYVQHRMTGFGGAERPSNHAGPRRPSRLHGAGRCRASHG